MIWQSKLKGGKIALKYNGYRETDNMNSEPQVANSEQDTENIEHHRGDSGCEQKNSTEQITGL